MYAYAHLQVRKKYNITDILVSHLIFTFYDKIVKVYVTSVVSELTVNVINPLALHCNAISEIISCFKIIVFITEQRPCK